MLLTQRIGVGDAIGGQTRDALPRDNLRGHVEPRMVGTCALAAVRR
jgi:hypothetical protein